MIIGMDLDQVDMKTAQFAYELSLSGVGDVALRVLDDMDDPPSRFWHPIRRACWEERYNLLTLIYAESSAARLEQERASSR